jgi:hypothetical protein
MQRHVIAIARQFIIRLPAFEQNLDPSYTGYTFREHPKEFRIEHKLFLLHHCPRDPAPQLPDAQSCGRFGKLGRSVKYG